MKQDDGAWQLDRLSPADAPELCRAVDAAKQQLPSAQQLAALAASLSVQGLPLSTGEAARAGLPRFPGLRKHWLLIGSAVLGAIVICIGLARLRVAPSNPASSEASATPAEPRQPGLGWSVSAATDSPRASGNRAALEPTPSTPELAVSDAPAPSSAPVGSGPVPAATIAGESAAVRPTPGPAPAIARSPTSPRTSQPTGSAQGASLGAGSKVQPSEVELLRDARLALRTSPALALGLTEQHSALYPRGTMVQERELIAISALALLGRHAAVLSRAQRFEHDFPGSPYRKQIAQIAE